MLFLPFKFVLHGAVMPLFLFLFYFENMLNDIEQHLLFVMVLQLFLAVLHDEIVPISLSKIDVAHS